MTPTRILLTGASGAVGSAVLERLDHRSVIAMTHRRSLPGPGLRGNIIRPRFGMSRDEYRALAAQIDVVIHCAAGVTHSPRTNYLHKVNVDGVAEVLRFVADADARLVYTTTAFTARTGANAPFDAYADTKAAGDALVRESGAPASVAHISTVIGDPRAGRTTRLQALEYLLGFGMSGQLPFLPLRTRYPGRLRFPRYGGRGVDRVGTQQQ
ncbi:SDR family oxidoreductase [Nocardia sp. N2S4-5]|uniref:SDR family oxidoreductase n=1 Tax=Nocardia sp. N2S4-5 TaxID=3351565 RepID=UPI0037D29524